MTPLKSDIAARVARERAEACECDACRLHTELYGSGYRLFPLADPGGVAPRPVRLTAKHEGACVSCCAPIAVGDAIWWTRGADGIECSDCGGRS